jgi:hypothetical protein
MSGVNHARCLSGEILQGCIGLLPMMCDEGFVEYKGAFPFFRLKGKHLL